jgi:cob(I)alamin adenosyltransferase
MVHLSRIYTKTGDDGTTGLGDGSRVPKTDARVEAYGTVDEANSVLGVALLVVQDPVMQETLRAIQNDLFDVGADLCSPLAEGETPGARLRITPVQVKFLEEAIDHWNADLPALRSFVLPGGTAAAAWLHLARTVVRRAERLAVAAQRLGGVNAQAVIYLNRLSDLCFVLARAANAGAGSSGDVLWEPGRGQGADPGKAAPRDVPKTRRLERE